ncbi:MAG: hypothetical protein K0S38_824 [Candidatus Paceibacter sp.]|jgi:vancomycin permeability regulator SanA|nr:hypothetical protein [Candidatus Paceibacter sp.]
MPNMIYLVGKSPIPTRGRIGPEKAQDWYKMCVYVAKEYHQNPGTLVLLITGFSTADEGKEMDWYMNTLIMMGVSSNDMRLSPVGVETIKQLETALPFSRIHYPNFTIVCTMFHFPRVRYLCWRMGLDAKFKVTYGWPRPAEAISDMILSVAFPFIDMLGLREKFLTFVKNRRAKGKV